MVLITINGLKYIFVVNHTIVYTKIYEKMHKVFIIVLTWTFASSLENDIPLVKTELGLVEGHYKKSYNGKLFSAFEGIPYAKPPIGSLRFEEPQPAGPWLGKWTANKVHTCIQPYLKEAIGNEDCLYINVYTPRLHPTHLDNLDVIVHIHGGGFIVGDPDLAGPFFLMDRDIIYVNFNYRLGALGFLSTEDDIVKGNMGLKDQVLALKWIKENIKQFGGNPLSVTLTGMSAGATSAHLHYFSSNSKGLFHRGLSQSGTATAPWVIQKYALRNAKMLASLMGCDLDLSKTMIQCMRQRPAINFVINKISHISDIQIIVFSPVVENNGSSAFLTDYPYHLLQKGEFNDVPWISSITTEEGIVGILNVMSRLEYIDKHWNDIAPFILSYNTTCIDSVKNDVSEAIKQHYFKTEPISKSNIPALIKLFTDRSFYLGLESSAQIQSKLSKSSVYSYIYGYKEESINAEKLFGLDEDFGVNHGADGHLLYNVKFLGINLSSATLTKSDEFIKNFLVDMVVGYAKSGKPFNGNIDWEPVNSSKDFSYLFINRTGNMYMKNENQQVLKDFWKSLQLKEDEYFEK